MWWLSWLFAVQTIMPCYTTGAHELLVGLMAFQAVSHHTNHWATDCMQHCSWHLSVSCSVSLTLNTLTKKFHFFATQTCTPSYHLCQVWAKVKVMAAKMLASVCFWLTAHSCYWKYCSYTNIFYIYFKYGRRLLHVMLIADRANHNCKCCNCVCKTLSCTHSYNIYNIMKYKCLSASPCEHPKILWFL